MLCAVIDSAHHLHQHGGDICQGGHILDEQLAHICGQNGGLFQELFGLFADAVQGFGLFSIVAGVGEDGVKTVALQAVPFFKHSFAAGVAGTSAAVDAAGLHLALDAALFHADKATGHLVQFIFERIGYVSRAVLHHQHGAALAVAHVGQVVTEHEDHLVCIQAHAVAVLFVCAQFRAPAKALAGEGIQAAQLKRAAYLHLAGGIVAGGFDVQPHVIKVDFTAGPTAPASGEELRQLIVGGADAFAHDFEGASLRHAAEQILHAPPRRALHVAAVVHAFITGNGLAFIPLLPELMNGRGGACLVPGEEQGQVCAEGAQRCAHLLAVSSHGAGVQETLPAAGLRHLAALLVFLAALPCIIISFHALCAHRAS